MDLDKIRQMDDEELTKLLRKIPSYNTTRFCAKCKSFSIYNIKIERPNKFQTRKLCGLCQKHYDKLLEFLKVDDIDWDQ